MVSEVVLGMVFEGVFKRVFETIFEIVSGRLTIPLFNVDCLS